MASRALDEDGVQWLSEEINAAFGASLEIEDGAIVLVAGNGDTISAIQMPQPHIGSYCPETKTIDLSGGIDE